jgi:hypothetical protein
MLAGTMTGTGSRSLVGRLGEAEMMARILNPSSAPGSPG